MYKRCARIWRKEEWIEEWSEGTIVLIRKKGERNKVVDYREVTITQSLYKIYATILGERQEREIEEKKIVP